ncbi:hypothetical protein AOLI_G00274480 [Acnodon oligacanthus]
MSELGKHAPPPVRGAGRCGLFSWTDPTVFASPGQRLVRPVKAFGCFSHSRAAGIRIESKQGERERERERKRRTERRERGEEERSVTERPLSLECLAHNAAAEQRLNKTPTPLTLRPLAFVLCLCGNAVGGLVGQRWRWPNLGPRVRVKGQGSALWSSQVDVAEPEFSRGRAGARAVQGIMGNVVPVS